MASPVRVALSRDGLAVRLGPLITNSQAHSSGGLEL